MVRSSGSCSPDRLAIVSAVTEPDLENAIEEPVRRTSGAARLGALYLLLLTGIASGLIGFVVLGNLADDGEGPVETTTTTSPVDGTPVEIALDIQGMQATLRGAVPDEGAEAQLVGLAEARYGEGNVFSELSISSDAVLAGGVVNVTGSAEEGDDQPLGLQADIAAALGLRAGDVDLTLTERALTPVAASAVITNNTIVLDGAFPDAAARDQFVLVAEQIYGAENVQAASVSVDSTTSLQDAQFNISGLIDAGDTRGQEFTDRVLAFFGGSSTETSGLEIDTSPEALARLEAKLREQVEQQPILFASGSTDLTEENDPILQSIADAILATPGINVEVVGHTDNQGSVEINQELSERRAEAVQVRLIELGVPAERLDFRGAGESEPIGDNDTEEGRDANRRIAFEFEGAL